MKNKNSLAQPIILLTVLLLFLLIPYTKNGFWFDDTLNSQVWGLLHRFNTTLPDFSMKITMSWLQGSGRLLLGWINTYSFFYIFTDVRLLRITDILFVFAHVATFVILLRTLQASTNFIAIFLATLFGLFQIRDYHDPIGAYSTFYQTLGIQLTLGLIFLIKWKKTLLNKYLCYSSIIIFWSLLYYEINLIYYPIAFTIIATSPQETRTRLKSLIIIFVPLIVFLGIELYIKHIAKTSYAGSSFGALNKILPTYSKQLLSTLPGSYYFIRGIKEYDIANVFHNVLHSPIALSIIFLAGFSFYSFWKMAEKESCKAIRTEAYLCAGALLLFPPCLVALSARYQDELQWGLGYLPVYYQYFGLALLSTAATIWLVKWSKGKAIFLLVPVASIYMSANWIINIHVSKELDNAFYEPRRSLELALHDGLFNNVKDGDIVEINGSPIFINGNLIYQTIGKRVVIPNEIAIAGFYTSTPRKNPNRFTLERIPELKNRWFLKKITNH